MRKFLSVLLMFAALFISTTASAQITGVELMRKQQGSTFQQTRPGYTPSRDGGTNRSVRWWSFGLVRSGGGGSSRLAGYPHSGSTNARW